ncbi:MAG: YraN family protein [Pyrinomonadaceae bacterium]|nr:YraN family protein [Acidobacteriota bacterium]
MSEIISITNQDIRPAAQSSSATGRAGEKLAADLLVDNGYRLILANFKVPIGRNTKGVQVAGEIDLIALDGEIVCFIEVKTRRSADFASPLASVNLRKQRQITRTARVYRRIFGLQQSSYRFDVVSVLLENANEPKIELIKGFWNEQKFRKRAWSGDVW